MTVGSQVKGCYSSIKSAEATLASLAAKTQNQETKKVFEMTQELLGEVKGDLEKQVIRLGMEEPQYRN